MTLYKMSQYFPKPYEPYGGNINVKSDLSYYATKADIKNITHIDTSSFALKTNLANLKSEVDKLDVDKLKPVPTDLSKLSEVVKNDVVKKADYSKLLTKVDNIDTSGLIKKTDYNTKITEIEGKITDVSDLVKKTNYNSKISEIDIKIPDTSNLAAKTALTSVENEIPSISNLVKKTDCNTKITDIENKLNNHDHDKYINTSEFNKLAADVFNPISKYLKVAYVNDITYVLSWKSRGLNDAKIESIKTNSYSFNPRMDHYDTSKIRTKFDGSFLNRFPPTILYGNIVNIYIAYEITSDYKDINYPTLEN